MKVALVTGVAGFIGSHLAEALLARDYSVRGVDCFRDYYPRSIKETNLQRLRESPDFSFVEADLVEADLPALLEGVDYVFHVAAQAGVRASWGSSFERYTHDNVLATQTLLEACKDLPLQKFVYSSSSSIYGDAQSFPTPEDALPKPVSPYGVTKLAGEHLVYLYHVNYGLPTISLRYFTVYGPRQRPDMAFHKFIRAALEGAPITLYVDGEQTRDFTFVADAVRANLLAAESSAAGVVANIGGGAQVSVNYVLELIGKLTGKSLHVEKLPVQKGDVKHTCAEGKRAAELFGYRPQIPLEEGLAREVEWLQQLLATV